jgi:hypothetical protein
LKSDLRDAIVENPVQRKDVDMEPVPKSTREATARAINATAYFERSAKLQINVKEVFEQSAKIGVDQSAVSPAKSRRAVVVVMCSKSPSLNPCSFLDGKKIVKMDRCLLECDRQCSFRSIGQFHV